VIIFFTKTIKCLCKVFNLVPEMIYGFVVAKIQYLKLI